MSIAEVYTTKHSHDLCVITSTHESTGYTTTVTFDDNGIIKGFECGDARGSFSLSQEQTWAEIAVAQTYRALVMNRDC